MSEKPTLPPPEAVRTNQEEGSQEEAGRANIDSLWKRMVKDNFANIRSFSKEEIQSSKVQSMVKNRILAHIEHGNLHEARRESYLFIISRNFPQSPEVQSAAAKGIIYCLKQGFIKAAVEIRDTFNLPQSPELQSAVKEEMINCLKIGHIDPAIKIINAFKLPSEVVQSPEVQSAAKKEMIFSLKNGRFDDAIKIRDALNLLPEVVQSVIKEVLIFHLEESIINFVFQTFDAFIPSPEVIRSPEIQTAAKERIIASLERGDVYDAVKIRDDFGLPTEFFQSSEIQSMARKGIIGSLRAGRSFYTADIPAFNTLILPPEFFQSPEVQSAAKEALIINLKYGDIDSAIRIRDTFTMSPEAVRSPEVQSAVEEGIKYCQTNRYIKKERITKIREAFELP